MSVTNKNLLCYQIKFQSKTLHFILLSKTISVNNFYAVLIFYGYVGTPSHWISY